MQLDRDRFRGALVGLAAGDAVGTTLEFKRPGTFQPIDDMVGGGPFGLTAGQWTDDTSMALCLAESIVESGGDLDPADQLTRYHRWWKDGHLSSTGVCFDIGLTTTKAILRWKNEQTVTAPVVDQEAAANGSLMRLAPVPMRWAADPALAGERSAESSRTTHPADRPVQCCQVYGTMIAVAIGGGSEDEILDPARFADLDLHPEVRAIVDGSYRTKEPPEIKGTGYCVAALEASLWAFARSDTYRDAVLAAANLGDDADTTAAICGQLAGAFWGESGIPADWRSKLALPDTISGLADGLWEAAG
ncbi:ADP-ribosylglycohydrolase family protein [Actinospongicola halichondriae]|uniref:ADP-ribosylglycohydrolase family protein n=1 Tax=Actinospongicola halichondriae TaxID=3236844 RepID=UPI003D53CF6D